MNLQDYENKFPNGVTSYLETHHEIVEYIVSNFDESPFCKEVQQKQGQGGIWELAEKLTDEFEKLHKDTFWEGDWEETIWAFCQNKLGVS